MIDTAAVQIHEQVMWYIQRGYITEEQYEQETNKRWNKFLERNGIL